VSDKAIERVIVPPTRDLGDGFNVRRALPSAQCRLIGPFVFFDQFGPTVFAAGAGLDVRPHPHIGLATVTYLFNGELVHRDSLGSRQVIRPGAVNWMIAGAGIVHSERTAADTRQAPSALAGIQSWVALPQAEEQRPASFAHYAADELPRIEGSGRCIRVIAGALFGLRAPVATLSPLGYADAALEPGAQLEFGTEFEQRAIYIAAGVLESHGRRLEAARLLVLRANERVSLTALVRSRDRAMCGGTSFPARASASSRPRQPGATGDSSVCRGMTTNSFPCRPRPAPRSAAAHRPKVAPYNIYVS
jgi:redox-sensitive bicupin YhaK (pirin superfamily)